MSYDDYNDYDDYDDKEGYDEEIDFVSEWNVLKRVGGKMRLTDDFDVYKKGKYGSDLSPEQLFLKGVQKTIDSYQLSISDMDLDLIKNKLVFKINLIKFKNPSAFIFSYISLDNKYNINKEKIETILQIIEKPPINNLGLDASFVTKEDIIRYARLIKKNL